jgi:lysophospholipase L1-like esterase
MLVHGWSAGTRRRSVTALVALLALTVVGAEVARAACGGVEQVKPRKDVTLGRSPIAIGDSPMLLALGDLAKVGYKANARGCRQWTEGLDLIRALKRKDHLPRLVVVALGSNGSVTKGDIRDALDLVGKRRSLGLVTPREVGGVSGHDADVVRTQARKHKHRTVLLDWVKYSAGHPAWFQADGLHLTFDGAAAMARLFQRPLKHLPPPH